MSAEKETIIKLQAQLDFCKNELDEEKKNRQKLSQKIGYLEGQLKVLQERYEKLKHPEVVRSEIERIEKIFSSGFSINTSLTTNLKGHAESAEIRRQKWLFILENSTRSDMDFFRSTILLSNLEPKYLNGFSTKKLQNLKGYDRQFQLNFLLKTHLNKRWKNDAFIEGLLQFLNGEPCNLDLPFSVWKQKQFEDFALKISAIYGEISTRIHAASFDKSDQLPKEYEILLQPVYDKCINILLSFYKI